MYIEIIKISTSWEYKGQVQWREGVENEKKKTLCNKSDNHCVHFFASGCKNPQPSI